MKMVYLSEIEEENEFAKDALNEIEPGCRLALKWGMGDDCVLVLKLDQYHTPTIYQQIIRKEAKKDV